MSGRTYSHRSRKIQLGLERRALDALRRLREPLFRELERLEQAPDYNLEEEPHLCCLRKKNQMRISPLEAKAIYLAFLADRTLRPKLPAVLARLERVLPSLQDNTERQNFDCPLLDGKLCLVHRAAKPIGCLAWNAGRDYSKAAWRAFGDRDRLNDNLYGPDWKLRVIPLWLKRVFKSYRR